LAFLFAAILAVLLAMGCASAHPMHQPQKKFTICPRNCVARKSTR
jgi:outer membrane murein-binding lipoprotein Lpp